MSLFFIRLKKPSLSCEKATDENNRQIMMAVSFFMIGVSFGKNKGAKVQNFPKLARGLRVKNEIKNEILPFCQFFSFGIKIDKRRPLQSVCNGEKTTKQVTNK